MSNTVTTVPVTSTGTTDTITNNVAVDPAKINTTVFTDLSAKMTALANAATETVTAINACIATKSSGGSRKRSSKSRRRGGRKAKQSYKKR